MIGLLIVAAVTMGSNEVKAVSTVENYPGCTDWYLKISGGILYACRMCATCSPTCLPVEECRSFGPMQIGEQL